MKCTTIFLLMTLLFSSCKENTEQKKTIAKAERPYPHHIDISEGLKNKTEFKLSFIADSIKYIVLSKDKDVLLGDFLNLEMTDSDIFISHDGEFYRFDHNGRFLSFIGKEGHGPTEHFGGSVFTVSPLSERVYVRRNGISDYIYYNFTGNYLGNISLPRAVNFWSFTCLSDSVFLFTYQYVGRYEEEYNDVNLCGLFDKDGNKIQVIEHPVKNQPPGTDISRIGVPIPFFTFYQNEVVLPYQDTVYKINSNSITTGFIFDWGNTPHRRTFEEQYYIQTKPSDKVRFYGRFFEVVGKAYFMLRQIDEFYLFEYDKYTGKTKSMNNIGTEDNRGFVNDLDGGAKYYPKWSNRAGDIWITYNNAIDFIELNNEEALSKSKVVDPGNKERLKAFLSTLSDDDNPVLKIVYLKKPVK